MENKINIAELLCDCPQGMELDCTMFDNVTFVKVDHKREQFPIEIAVGGLRSKYLTKDGCFHDTTLLPEAKCVIFPKGKTTWEGFVPTCQFKDGDILAYMSSFTTVFIYRNKDNEPKYTTSFYVGYTIDASYCKFHIYNKKALIALNGNCDTRLATEEEKAKLFQAIKDNGYNWNDETKTLEKLIKPIFNVGNKIEKCGYRFTIAEVKDDYYLTKCGNKIPIDNQDDFSLVSNKFDITTLKPFESRVLVRDYDNQIWIPTFWGKRLEDDSNCRYLTTNGCYKYCIPHEGNEHLLGTTNDCDDFYKIWE